MDFYTLVVVDSSCDMLWVSSHLLFPYIPSPARRGYKRSRWRVRRRTPLLPRACEPSTRKVSVWAFRVAACWNGVGLEESRVR